MLWIVVWGLTAIAASMIAGALAAAKNRDYSRWMAWAFLLPPLILVLAVLPRQEAEPRRRPTLDEEDREPD
jgi:hypothetical protein